VLAIAENLPVLSEFRMKNPRSGAKRGRKPKSTRSMRIEVHPKAYAWLEVLYAKGRFGNSVEDVVIYLLNERLKQLLNEGELIEPTTVEGAIPFPGESIQRKQETRQTT
jgi:hypothetical protein